MRKLTKSYEEHLAESLQDPEEAAAYLTAALEDEDPRMFLLALQDVATARGIGMSDLATAAKLNRENLYRILSEKGNPQFSSLKAVLEALDFQLAIQSKQAG